MEQYHCGPEQPTSTRISLSCRRTSLKTKPRTCTDRCRLLLQAGNPWRQYTQRTISPQSIPGANPRQVLRPTVQFQSLTTSQMCSSRRRRRYTRSSPQMLRRHVATPAYRHRRSRRRRPTPRFFRRSQAHRNILKTTHNSRSEE